MAMTALIEHPQIARTFTFPLDRDMNTADVCVFDSVISEKHQCQIAITENPVETGVSMVDHAYAKPDVLVMEVAVSDTPLLERRAGEQATTSYQLAKDRGMIFTSGNERRSVNAWQYILDKAKSFAVFDVQTGLRLHKNMMFVSATAQQTKDDAGWLRATIEMRQVIFAGTSSALYQPREKKVQRQVAKKKDDGKQPVEEPAPAIQERVKSTLREWTDARGWTK